jgi:antitoxin component of MazEF toxin-antitoxin module
MRHVVTLIEDPETGDLVMPFPEGMCDELGWEIGDTLQWNVQEDGTIILTKADQEK